jgi:hypothetical protein
VSRRTGRATGLLAATFSILSWTSPGLAAASATGSSPVVIEVDRSTAAASHGETITFTSTMTNTGTAPMAGVIAHLSILSSDPDVYIDPEDWSSERTQYFDELDAGESAQQRWSIQAITGGPLVLYVTVTDQSERTAAVSSPIAVQIAGQRIVTSGGVLPLVISVPAGILLVLVLTLVRRRRYL